MGWTRWTALLIVAWPALAAAQSAPASCPGTKLTCADGACRLELQFKDPGTCAVRIDDAFIATANQATPGSATRITEATTFRIRVRHVNLLRYALDFDTKETVIDTYVFLETLWKQVLGLGTRAAPSFARSAVSASDEEKAFVNAINAWRKALAEADDDLSTFLAKFPTLTLTDADEAAIKANLDVVKTTVTNLEKNRAAAENAIVRSENFPIYDATVVLHQGVIDRLNAFRNLAAQVAAGLDKRIKFGAAGRVVAVTVTATDINTKAEKAGTSIGVEFFVHSTLPVTFHVGYTVRGLSEARFETVQSVIAAGTTDLFTKVQDTSASSGFTAFMSYRVCKVATASRGCPQLTIGTDFKNVGDRLYGGVSWPLGRAFITVGAVNGETQEGQNKVTDIIGSVGQAVNARELFTTIATKRKWGGFVGLSFAPF
jgi:hypothetical protein